MLVTNLVIILDGFIKTKVKAIYCYISILLGKKCKNTTNCSYLMFILLTTLTQLNKYLFLKLYCKTKIDKAKQFSDIITVIRDNYLKKVMIV